MCTRETTKDGRVFDEPFIATNRAYVEAYPLHDWAPLYSQSAIDTLRAQLEAAQRGIVERDDDMVVPLALWEEMDRAGLEWKARAEAAEANAARYEWLRAHQVDRFVRNNEHEPCLLLPFNVDCLSLEATDAAIDAAMSRTKEETNHE